MHRTSCILVQASAARSNVHSGRTLYVCEESIVMMYTSTSFIMLLFGRLMTEYCTNLFLTTLSTTTRNWTCVDSSPNTTYHVGRRTKTLRYWKARSIFSSWPSCSSWSFDGVDRRKEPNAIRVHQRALSTTCPWSAHSPHRYFGIFSLQWRHNEYDGVSNHQPYDCL